MLNEQEFETYFLDIPVIVSFIDHEGTVEITACRTGRFDTIGEEHEINYHDMKVRKYASVDMITGEAYLENEANTHIAGRL